MENESSTTDPDTPQAPEVLARHNDPISLGPISQDVVLLFGLLQVPACLFGENGEVTSINQAWRDYAAFLDSVGAPSHWSQLIHPDDRYEALSHFRASCFNGRYVGFECRLLRGDGVPRWFLFQLHPVGGEGARRMWLGVATDIHDLKCREFDLERRASIQTDMLNISVDCIKLIALDGTLVHMNEAGCRALGVSSDSYFGMPWLQLLPEDVWESGRQALAIALTGMFSRFPGRSVAPGQPVQYWDNMLTPILNAAGRPTAILCVSREVTAEKEALESLRDNEERLAIAARVGGLGIWDYNIERDELHCDAGWYRIMGIDGNAFPVRSISDFQPMIHPEDVDRATEVTKVAEELIADQRDYSIVFRIVRPGGEIRWVRSAAYLQHSQGIPRRAVGFVVDITDAWKGELALRDANRALESEKISLARQSLEDALTGLPNRRCLDNELTKLCLRVEDGDDAICVGMIDVDYFKLYNDRYGHLEGDAALRKVAVALQSVARQSDLVARYGGEEFAFIIVGADDPVAIFDRFMRVVSDLSIAHEDSPTGFLTISCGCAILPPHGRSTPNQLLRIGDEALYEAKILGRNRYVVRSLNA